ncbi:MAG: hypothetical protein KC492_18045 [Myxococcales bacterium]|nr:hypothetical protein [Myxococcales bacterium]MCB9610288.1 hypothetical protein [Polyangiaceae bacterium]
MDEIEAKQVSALEQTSAEAGKRLKQHLAVLGPHEQQVVVALTAQVQSLLSVGQLALFGYDAAQEGHTGFSSMQLAPATAAWAQASSRTKTAVVVIGMVASTLADLVEVFLAELSGSHPELELHRRSDGQEWARQIESVFEIDLGADTRAALASIVDVRRAFTAELDALPPGLGLVQYYSAWPPAVIILAEATLGRVAAARKASVPKAPPPKGN